MEIEELKTIWQQYDRQLNNLEKLNKKLVMETLLKRPESKLTRMKFQSIYGILVGPIVLVIALHPLFKIENFYLKFIVGCILSLMVLIYLVYINFKGLSALKGINLGGDPVIESARKVNNFKSIVNTRQKSVFITYPILGTGILLIIWKDLQFDIKTLIIVAGFLIFSRVLAYKQFKNQQQRIAELEKEILDLKEYEA